LLLCHWKQQEKLHRLLIEVEDAGRSDVISFDASGRAFQIHNPDKFFKEIIPLYFRISRLSSFKRQLNLYAFEMINTGPSRGGYFHALFIKDQPDLCRRMRRVAIKMLQKNDDHEEALDGNDHAKVTIDGTDPLELPAQSSDSDIAQFNF
jgi:HSF-type DNA-binding